MNIHQRKLMETAARLGIHTEDLSPAWGLDIVTYARNGRRLHIIEGQLFPGLTHRACTIMDHKVACKRLLADLEVPTLPDLLLTRSEEESPKMRAFLDTHGTVVCKPVTGFDGQGVKVGVTDLQDLLDHLDHFPDKPFFLEAYKTGKDLRIQAIGGSLVAACIRQPTTLVGDGKTDVQGLIDRRNREIVVQNPNNRVDIDDDTRSLLAAAGYGLDSVLPVGTRVTIKKVANMAQGARAIDVTDQVHDDYHEVIARVAEALELSIFAMDFIAPDHQSPMAEGAIALEVNACPAWMHHTFSERRSHDIPALILEELFR